MSDLADPDRARDELRAVSEKLRSTHDAISAMEARALERHLQTTELLAGLIVALRCVFAGARLIEERAAAAQRAAVLAEARSESAPHGGLDDASAPIGGSASTTH